MMHTPTACKTMDWRNCTMTSQTVYVPWQYARGDEGEEPWDGQRAATHASLRIATWDADPIRPKDIPVRLAAQADVACSLTAKGWLVGNRPPTAMMPESELLGPSRIAEIRQALDYLDLCLPATDTVGFRPAPTF